MPAVENVLELQRKAARLIGDVPGYQKKATKLLSCQHSLYADPKYLGEYADRWCGLRSCLMCRRAESEMERRYVLKQVHSVQSEPLLALSITLKLKDCDTDAIKAHVRTLDRGWVRMLKGSRMGRFLYGGFRAIEVKASGLDPQKENVHAHGILFLKPGFGWPGFSKPGRNYLSSAGWLDLWAELAGRHARGELTYGLNVKRMLDSEEFEKWTRYITKFQLENEQLAQDGKTVGRYIQRIEQTYKMPLWDYSGLFQVPYDKQASEMEMNRDLSGLTRVLNPPSLPSSQHNQRRSSDRCRPILTGGPKI